MEKLKNVLWDELDEIARKGELSAGDLDTVHKLTDTIKNIDKICMLEDGYSSAGEWEADMRGHYGHAGKHYVRGHYSRAGGKERMIEEMRAYMQSAGDDRTRDAVRRCMEQLESL